MGERMIDRPHPPPLLALARFDGAFLAGLLERLALAVEVATPKALLTAIAKETRARADDMDNRRDFDPQINPHDALRDSGFRRWRGEGDFRHPFAAFAFDAQQPWRPRLRQRSPRRSPRTTAENDLADLALLKDGKNKVSAFRRRLTAPVLIVPLADRLAKRWQTTERQSAFHHRPCIPEGLVLDRTRQCGGEVLRTGLLRQDTSINGARQDIDAGNILLAVGAQQRRLFGRRVETDEAGGGVLPHDRDGLSLSFVRIDWLTG